MEGTGESTGAFVNGSRDSVQTRVSERTTRRAGQFLGLGGRSVTPHPEHRSTSGMTGEATEAGAGWGLGQDPGEKQKESRTGAQKCLAVGCKFYFYFFKYLFGCTVLAAAHRLFSLRGGTWDLVP